MSLVSWNLAALGDIPSHSRGRDFVFLAILTVLLAAPSTPQFVGRSGTALSVNGRAFRFLGGNAYFLGADAARGDTDAVRNVFAMARGLGMTVVRTWGFHDGADSLDTAVIQHGPGKFNERALRGLDYVLLQAQRHGIRLLLPLVNGWDDYGGMNQYVRWKVMNAGGTIPHEAGGRPGEEAGEGNRRYRIAITPSSFHDDFYRDPVIRSWYANYVRMLLTRINTFSGIAYRMDTTILGWELANEPRSSDRSGLTIRGWLDEMGALIKSIDVNHLIGSGEEGFDISGAGYRDEAYYGQTWLFDGSSGTSFSLNSASPSLDFASAHLYPESWNLPNAAGGNWIRDHLRVAATAGKPLILGEFGVRTMKIPTYDSWLSTAAYDGVAGAVVWQILKPGLADQGGFGIYCPEPACQLLASYAPRFSTPAGSIAVPSQRSLRQNYPNPFNGQTTISYDLPRDGKVLLDLWSSVGARVATLVDGPQGAGERKELLDARRMASGVYFYRLRVDDTAGGFSESRTMILIR